MVFGQAATELKGLEPAIHKALKRWFPFGSEYHSANDSENTVTSVLKTAIVTRLALMKHSKDMRSYIITSNFVAI
jgi:hypothetical protein